MAIGPMVLLTVNAMCRRDRLLTLGRLLAIRPNILRGNVLRLKRWLRASPDWHPSLGPIVERRRFAELTSLTREANLRLNLRSPPKARDLQPPSAVSERRSLGRFHRHRQTGLPAELFAN